MEDIVLRRMRTALGWTQGDGIFCPGGSVSNMYGLNVARYIVVCIVGTQSNGCADTTSVQMSRPREMQLQVTW